VDWFLSEALGLAAGVRWHLMPGNDLDNIGFSADWGADHVDANNSMFEAFLGVNVMFGASDRDRDGISDGRDACRNSPEDFDGFEDEDGCPDLDNDGDGIADFEDLCPGQPEDFDHFQDADGCPDPDNDGDGIADPRDRCPDEAEDLDGNRDADGCPDPDDDADGVPDAQDKCPDTPAGAHVEADGCPAPVAVLEEDLVLFDVQFESGNARLLPQSNAPLRELAKTLLAHPEVRIEVRGHTDDEGSSESNRDLSQRRAVAVRQALIAMGVAAERIVSVGYGEDYPIDTNATPEGRARNRRVEIHRID
jgi:outer membrane protein OmpA-like peptidoglycan-associated protein